MNAEIAGRFLGEELVEMKYQGYQNEKLENSFREFYQLASSPKVTKKLIVTMTEYKRFLKSRTKERTQFEPKESEIYLGFSEQRVPFEFVATHTKFDLPSGKSVALYEQLDAPCGLTDFVEAKFGDEKQKFSSYFEAEQFVLTKFLEEIR